MVAKQDHTYAQILNDQLHWIFTKTTLPEWNASDIQVIDITNITPQPQVGWSYINNVFTEPDLPQFNINGARELKSEGVRKACEQSIITGFTSTALTTSHLYPSNDRDQVNLSGTIQKSLLPSAQPTDYYPFLCADINGAWEYRPHTAAQIQQVGVDAYNAILQARVKNATLQYQITQATNQAELDAIVW